MPPSRWQPSPRDKLEGILAYSLLGAVAEAVDRPALRALSATRYEYAEWKQALVNIGYHIDAHGHYYSVPHRLVRQKLDVA